MKLTSKEMRHNPLLKRKELSVIIEHDGQATPSKAALQHYIAREMNTHIECVDIKNIFSFGGASKSQTKIFIWDEKKVPDLSKAGKKEEKADEKKEAEE